MTILTLVILLGISLFVHFLYFGHPMETVFDEVHFGGFVSGYFTGKYFFDIHPPLGKLLISGMGYLGEVNPVQNFETIGREYLDSGYLWLRLLPTLAGVFLPLIIYLLARRLRFSQLGATLAGLFVIFENSILTQSRFILLDSFLLLFGFAGLLFYLIGRDRGKIGWFILSALSLGLAISVKWTGGSFLLLVGLIELFYLLKTRPHFGRWLRQIILFGAIPFIVYSGTFAIHFALLPNSGPGDAFMGPAFQKTLKGSLYERDQTIDPINFWHKFTELNIQMFQANQNLTAEHPYSSTWETWPFMGRTIFYWLGSPDVPDSQNLEKVRQPRIYLVGNPIIYWASTLGIILLLGLSFLRSKIYFKNPRATWIIISGFLINFIPFLFIGRVMFLYHYMSALIFTILALVYILDCLEKNRKVVFASCIIVAIAFFSFFAPLSYGTPLSSEQFRQRIWLPSWE